MYAITTSSCQVFKIVVVFVTMLLTILLLAAQFFVFQCGTWGSSAVTAHAQLPHYLDMRLGGLSCRGGHSAAVCATRILQDAPQQLSVQHVNLFVRQSLNVT